jgi:8-hydroxy-5-deazaflavin:NADPH oxidoreductase
MVCPGVVRPRMQPVRIGILGGTGPAGSALAARLADVGYDVVVGSRSKYRAMEVRDSIWDRWPERELAIEASDNEGAAEADLIILATPWDSAATTALSVADALDGKVVITMANALARIGKEFVPLIPPRGSVAASVQATVRGARVAAAFQHVPAKELGELDHPVESDVLICSDHPTAVATTTEIVEKIPGFRALDSGELSNATAIEAFTAVLLQLNIRYSTRVALKLTGIRP